MSDKNKVYVGRLDWNACDDDLLEVFERYGTITDTSIIKDRATGRGRGYAFITFDTIKSADDAVIGANGKKIHGREIIVNIAKPRTNRTYSGSGYSNDRYGGSYGGSGGRYNSDSYYDDGKYNRAWGY